MEFDREEEHFPTKVLLLQLGLGRRLGYRKRRYLIVAKVAKTFGFPAWPKLLASFATTVISRMMLKDLDPTTSLLERETMSTAKKTLAMAVLVQASLTSFAFAQNENWMSEL
jgi:hypothetical protein